jgi:hypothetical protein
VLVQAAGGQADGLVPAQAFPDPVGVPLIVRAGLDEIFELHLLELARAEGVVARVDLVAERLADLRDAEGAASPGRCRDVVEVHEDALRRLGAEVGDGGVVLDRADRRCGTSG